MKELKKDTLSVPVIFQKVKQYSLEDTRFTKVKIWLMHTGINENGSCFDKEFIEKAIPTLANTPILAYVENNRKGEKDFSDHRRGFVTKDGERKLEYLGSAYGVIPETHNAHFEMRLCDDGVEREYLVVDGLLWNKLEDGVDILSKYGFKAQSMELDDENYDGYFDENGIFHFTHFAFYGACMLGLDVQPAMINSTVELAFCKTLKEEIKSKLEIFNEYVKGETGVAKEKDVEVVEEEVKTEHAKQQDEKEKEVEDTTEFATDSKGESETEESKEEETETEEEPKEESKDFETSKDEESEKEEVEEEKVEDESKDFEKTDEEEKVEEESEKEKVEVDHAKDEEKEESKDEEKESLEKEFTSLKEEHEQLKMKYAELEKTAKELQEYKDSRIKEDREKEESKLFARYDADLSGVTEYEELKAKATEFSTVTDLEKEIALLFTRKVKTSFSKGQEESTRAYFDNINNAENSRYGYLADKYKA